MQTAYTHKHMQTAVGFSTSLLSRSRAYSFSVWSAGESHIMQVNVNIHTYFMLLIVSKEVSEVKRIVSCVASHAKCERRVAYND